MEPLLNTERTLVMKKRIITIIAMLFLVAPVFAQTSSGNNKEKSVLASYYHGLGTIWGDSMDINGVSLGFYYDYYLTNSPIFLQTGAVSGFAHLDDYSAKFNNLYVGVPLGIGFGYEASEAVKLKPFFRITVLVDSNKGEHKSDGSVIKNGSIGTIAPEFGASAIVASKIALSITYALYWGAAGTWETGRTAEHGLYFGIGYVF